MFAREERERKDCERVSVSETVTLLFVSVSKETEERASCTRVEEASDMQARRNDAVWGPLSPQNPTRHRFEDHFPPNAQHGTVLGIFISPQKPNTAPFWQFLFPPKSQHDAVLGTNFPTKFPTLDPPILSVFFGLFIILVWFGLSGLMGLGFFSTLDNINVSIMSYYMIMGLGFFSTLDNINVSIMGYYMIMGLGFSSTLNNINIYILWVII
jgi:hypothetical protein